MAITTAMPERRSAIKTLQLWQRCSVAEKLRALNCALQVAEETLEGERDPNKFVESLVREFHGFVPHPLVNRPLIQ